MIELILYNLELFREQYGIITIIEISALAGIMAGIAFGWMICIIRKRPKKEKSEWDSIIKGDDHNGL